MKHIACWIVVAGFLVIPAMAQKPKSDPRDEKQPRGQMVDRWLQHVQERNPARYEELTALRASDPNAFREELKGVRRAMKGGPQAGHEKGLERSRAKTAKRVQQVRQAGPDEHAEAVSALRDHVASLFDMKEGHKARQVERMELKLSELKQQIEERQEHRDDIIDQRVSELLSGSE